MPRTIPIYAIMEAFSPVQDRRFVESTRMELIHNYDQGIFPWSVRRVRERQPPVESPLNATKHGLLTRAKGHTSAAGRLCCAAQQHSGNGGWKASPAEDPLAVRTHSSRLLDGDCGTTPTNLPSRRRQWQSTIARSHLLAGSRGGRRVRPRGRPSWYRAEAVHPSIHQPSCVANLKAFRTPICRSHSSST